MSSSVGLVRFGVRLLRLLRHGRLLGLVDLSLCLPVRRPFYALAGRDIPRTGRKGHKFQDATTKKGVIISSGQSDRGGGKTRRASGHSSLWTPWAHRAVTEAPGVPALSCSSASAERQAERLDPGNVIPRYTG